jgi:putative phage-type endonuclease
MTIQPSHITDVHIINENEIETGPLETVDVEADAESESEMTIPFYEKISESEKQDIIESIQFCIEDYLKTEIQKMSKPNFHTEMFDEITHIIFQSLQDANIFEDSDYDSLFDLVETQCLQWFENNHDCPMRTTPHYKNNVYTTEYELVDDFAIPYITEKIETLRKWNEVAPKQRTPEWYQQRYNMMTASNLWQALSTDAQKNRLIYEKCKPLDFGSGGMSGSENKWINTDTSLHWGVKYEPLTVMVYEKIMGVKIEEFGCIPHSAYPFIGASPDGIVTNIESPLYGRMLEIKNIFNREMDGIPSEAYWVQTQIQMECCDLDVCDFVETRFKEYLTETEFWEEGDPDRIRGIILQFVLKDGSTNVPVYKYAPLDLSLTRQCVDEWIDASKSEMLAEGYCVLAKLYWYLDEIAMSIVLRNSEWFQSVLPVIKETWETIETERVSGYEHRAAKKRVQTQTDVVVIETVDGTDSHFIKNMPKSKNGGICLVKIKEGEE